MISPRVFFSLFALLGLIAIIATAIAQNWKRSDKIGTIGLYVLIVAAMFAVLPGCVTMARYKADLKVAEAQDFLRYEPTLLQLSAALNAARERLGALGQLDAQGNLKPVAAAVAASTETAKKP